MELADAALVARSYLDAIKSGLLLRGTTLSSSFTIMNALEEKISLLLETVSSSLGWFTGKLNSLTNVTAEGPRASAKLQ
jgi:hypothetical protein